MSKRPLKSLVTAVRVLTTAQRAMAPAMNSEGRIRVINMSRIRVSESERGDLGKLLTAGDLPENISNKQDRNAGLVLCRGELELLLQIVKSSNGDCVAVKVVEPVHDPENGKDNPIKLADKLNLSRISFLVRSSVIHRREHASGLVFLQVVTLALVFDIAGQVRRSCMGLSPRHDGLSFVIEVVLSSEMVVTWQRKARWRDSRPS